MPHKDLLNMASTTSSALISISTPNHQLDTPDEEALAEPDEPSDNCNCNLLHDGGKLHFQDQIMYKKQTINPSRSNKIDSLLTRAIISDSEPHSADNDNNVSSSSIHNRVATAFRVPRRGMSTTSTISTASMPSTADLTSDAGDDEDDDSSSELSSPSPRPRPVPIFALPLIRDTTVAIKMHSSSDDDELLHHKSTVQPDPNEVTLALGRKRCITFACPTPVSRQNSDTKQKLIIEEPTPVRRATTLKFACNVKDECKPPKRSGSPPPNKLFAHRSPVLNATHLHPNTHHRRDSASTVVDERQKAIPCKAPSPLVGSVSSAGSIPRFYEFASSVDESVHSWMNAPQFPPSRLLKADCLLEKEKQIRKLSEEVEEDENEENNDDDDNDDNLEIEDEDEEDDGYKEDEEDDEYEIWSDSDDGNNTDSDEEEGAVDSDDEDEEDAYLPRTGTSIPDRTADRPSCCRNTSDSSLASVHDRKSGICSFQRERRTRVRPIRPSTPELPDSTDFVPGTFDEDKVLEDFYLSCMEDRKSVNKVIRPQDIDPSFPEGGDDDDEEEQDEEAERPVRRRRGSNVSVRSPRGSPTPNRRLRSPPPISRRGSRGMSPGKRRPSFTAKSPPPQSRTGRLRFELQANRASLARSTSLPRNGLYSRRKHCLTSTSPKPSKAIPFRKRSVLDIVKGLESKRMRRRENVYGRREYKAEAGEGVEKMREIGIMGRERVGANPAPKWILSF